MNLKDIFFDLYRASVETRVEEILTQLGFIQDPGNWRPYGRTESNFSVVENQQASPIPALIEKITNGVDAILMRMCLEQGIDPRSEVAPRSIEEALNRFFPHHKNWDLVSERNRQAESLQIIADGPRKETSLIIYDDGEGQMPESFEDTFLSLLQGNKNDIHFVQGKYNMGGTGAVVFCGERRYQLIGSKRFKDSDRFGFTLVRRHPLTLNEEKKKKSTWYEYLVVDGEIPSFALMNALDLGLRNRKFRTGTVIKLYSYHLPLGSRSVISRDLNQSINEYFFNPALPIFTIDRAERYPEDRAPERSLYGLKRRLEEEGQRYVEGYFSENVDDQEIGHFHVTCYVFRPRIEERSFKETKDTVRREFFKNNMSVLFSMNGQVHGSYTSEFITRSLKLPLLKDHLLIHVECTDIHLAFRNELFMASRDRLKKGPESEKLRSKLAAILAKSHLREIHKSRKSAITIENKEADDLVRSLTRNLPFRKELTDLIQQTFKLDNTRDGRRRSKAREKTEGNGSDAPVFSPQRYPTVLSIDLKAKDDEGIPMTSLPKGSERSIRFSTNAEDHYLDRTDDPGEFQIGLLEFDGGGHGNGRPIPSTVETVLDVVKSSPRNGTIRVQVRPTDHLQVGDAIKLKASLSTPSGTLEQIFLIKLTDPGKKPKEPKRGPQTSEQLGLPQLIMVYKNKKEPTWEKLQESGIDMDHEVVVYPFVEDGMLSTIYINMDSNVFLSYRARLKGEDAISTAERRYISAVYFHTLFLYTITKSQKYRISQEEDGQGSNPVEETEYISDLFKISYAQFLLNFGTQELIAALDS